MTKGKYLDIELIKLIMEEKNLTVKVVAERMNLTPATVRKYLNGVDQKHMNVSIIFRFAWALEISVLELFKS